MVEVAQQPISPEIIERVTSLEKQGFTPEQIQRRLELAEEAQVAPAAEVTFPVTAPEVRVKPEPVFTVTPAPERPEVLGPEPEPEAPEEVADKTIQTVETIDEGITRVLRKLREGPSTTNQLLARQEIISARKQFREELGLIRNQQLIDRVVGALGKVIGGFAGRVKDLDISRVEVAPQDFAADLTRIKANFQDTLSDIREEQRLQDRERGERKVGLGAELSELQERRRLKRGEETLEAKGDIALAKERLKGLQRQEIAGLRAGATAEQKARAADTALEKEFRNLTTKIGTAKETEPIFINLKEIALQRAETQDQKSRILDLEKKIFRFDIGDKEPDNVAEFVVGLNDILRPAKIAERRQRFIETRVTAPDGFRSPGGKFFPQGSTLRVPAEALKQLGGKVEVIGG